MDKIYHVYNCSIDEIEIFTNDNEYTRFVKAVQFYQIEKPGVKFSVFNRKKKMFHRGGGTERKRLVDIIAYCIMPAHFHLLLSQIKDGGIASFLNHLLNSYTRYFNTKYKRKGTIWEGKTKKVLVKIDEQLLHLTRYIHLNPVTAYLVDKPEQWMFSSYNEYLSNDPNEIKICNYESFLNTHPVAYRKFVEDGINYQREMAKAKKIVPPPRWNNI